MAYIRKTEDVWELWTNYGYGWECETTETSRKDAREQVKTYRENCPGIRIRVKKTRMLKEGQLIEKTFGDRTYVYET